MSEDPAVIAGPSACSPDGIRTRVTALRVRRPRPLDDGASRTRTGRHRHSGRCAGRVIGARGGALEPPTTGPEPVVLPITPPPKEAPWYRVRARASPPDSFLGRDARTPQFVRRPRGPPRP